MYLEEKKSKFKVFFAHIILQKIYCFLHSTLIHSYEAPVSERPEFWWVTDLLTPIVDKFLNLIYSVLTFHNVLELKFISLVLTLCFP